jgi:hypothetical protein
VRTSGAERVRQHRVVLAVVATVKPFAEMCASPTGWAASSIRGVREARRKVRLPGEHGISRPTIAQGRPSDWLHLYAAVRFFCADFRAADRGCQPAPGLPCALLVLEGGDAKLGRNAPRECEGVSAIQMRVERAMLSPPSLRGAKRRNNPESFRGGILDCSHGDLVCQVGWPALCSIAGQLFVPTTGSFGWRAQVRSRPAREGRREAAWS